MPVPEQVHLYVRDPWLTVTLDFSINFFVVAIFSTSGGSIFITGGLTLFTVKVFDTLALRAPLEYVSLTVYLKDKKQFHEWTIVNSKILLTACLEKITANLYV